MLKIELLQFSAFWSYVIVPLLSLVTLFVLPIRMYWSQTLTAKYCYNRVRSLEEADHLLITGKTGNVEIVEI